MVRLNGRQTYKQYIQTGEQMERETDKKDIRHTDEQTERDTEEQTE